VDYFVNTSASLTGAVVPFDGALFASPEPGFTLCTVTEPELTTTFADDEGRIIYQHSRTRQPEGRVRHATPETREIVRSRDGDD